MPTRVIHLTLAGVVAAARAAYDAGTLQAQQQQQAVDDVTCSYTGNCAIGAALSAADKKFLKSHSYDNKSSFALVVSGVFVVDGDDPDGDSLLISTIQRRHDAWVEAVHRGRAPIEVENARKSFVKDLDKAENVINARIALGE